MSVIPLTANISGIRTVTAFGLQESAIDLFRNCLLEKKRIGIINAHVNGFALGFSTALVSASYALTFWYA